MTTRDLVNHILLTGQKGYKDMEDGNRISDKMTLLVKEHIKAEADKMVSEKYDELLQQRDELREALINVMAIIKDCYPLLFDNEKPAVKQAEAAIKNTEKK